MKSAPTTRTRFKAAAVGAGLAGAMLVPAAASAQPQPLYPNQAHLTFTVVIAQNGVIQARSTLQPGFLRFFVKGHGHLQIAQSRNGLGKFTLVKDIATLNRTGKPGDLQRDFKVFGGVGHGHFLVKRFTPGTYYLVDSDIQHLTKSLIHKLTITGANDGSSEPQAAQTITAFGDMKWVGAPLHINASGTLHFRNNASGPHFIDLMQMQPGKDRSDITKALNGTENFGEVFTGVSYATGALAGGGQQQWSTYTLPRGRYGLLCFWPDEETGIPHAFLGMYRTIQVG